MADGMQPLHVLLDQHQKIERSVQEIPGGVKTSTTSADPAVAEMIRLHARQMQVRLEAGQPIRMWDPLFVEIFRHHDQIRMTVSDVPGGVEVVETSDAPEVTALIRQHANRGVSEFVTGGYGGCISRQRCQPGIPAERSARNQPGLLPRKSTSSEADMKAPCLRTRPVESTMTIAGMLVMS